MRQWQPTNEKQKMHKIYKHPKWKATLSRIHSFFTTSFDHKTLLDKNRQWFCSREYYAIFTMPIKRWLTVYNDKHLLHVISTWTLRQGVIWHFATWQRHSALVLVGESCQRCTAQCESQLFDTKPIQVVLDSLFVICIKP